VFARAGYDLSPILGDSRKLVHECGALRVLVLRSSDIATYVAHGAADVGVAGSDVLDEEGRDLLEPLDSDRAVSDDRRRARRRADRRSIALPPPGRDQVPADDARVPPAEGHHRGGDQAVGCDRARPLTGLCDRIVDITQTGETLRQNGLVEIDRVAEVSTRLVVNPARLKLDGDRLGALIDASSAPSADGSATAGAPIAERRV